MDIGKLAALCGIRVATSAAGLDELRRAWLPPALVELYRQAGGFETPSEVVVYRIEDLADRSETFEVARYSPGYCLIGDDSGGRGFLMACDGSSDAVFISGRLGSGGF